MKKAKKVLALALSILMVMSCLSAFAANESLTVVEKPVKIYFESDFSKEAANIDITDKTSSTKIEGGVLKVTNTTVEDYRADIYVNADKTGGIAEPVYIEFDISQNGLFHYSSNAINMFFVASNRSGFIDLTWFSNNNLRLYQDGSNQYSESCNLYKVHFKIKIDPLNKKYAVWVNGEEFVGEDEHNYIRNASNFTDFSYFCLKTSGTIAEITIDNFIVYSEPQTAFPMVEELYNESFDGVAGSQEISATQRWEIPAGVTGGSNVAYEVDIVGTSGTSNTHGITFRNDTNGCYTMVNWNSVASGYIDVRVWDTGATYIAQNKILTSDYNADNGKIKVTAVFNDAGNKVDLYANGMFLISYDFKNTSGAPESMEVQINSGTATIDNVRAYKFAKELDISQDENKVTIVTPEEKSGNLYFAKYDSDAETGKTLDSLGVAPLSLKPGKVYTIDKTNWTGAKAFFWDSNLTPIADSWNLN